MEKIRTVVVDDSEQTREALAGMLRSLRTCTVVGRGANGVEAVELARSLQPDLVVMDIHMPIMNGLEALHRLKGEAPDTRVVLVAPMVEPAVRDAALSAGAIACLQKGADLWDGLRDVVSQLARAPQEVVAAPGAECLG